MKFKTYLLSLILSPILQAQTNSPPLANEQLILSDGVQFIDTQAGFRMRLGFRIQSRLTYQESNVEDNDLADFQVRRMRLRLEGETGLPDFQYNLQFSLTRQDQDWDTLGVPNLLRDANVTWNWAPNHQLIFGLRKLPGNRQRVISSGAQELVDRSLVNAALNIDRDLGVQSWHQWAVQEQIIRLRLALTNGEGRGQDNYQRGLARTMRVEWLPWGQFGNQGDYFEGDLFFESQPKLSIGWVTHHNPQARRLGGQIGGWIANQQTRDLYYSMLDFVVKYQGWSLSGEWINKDTYEPFISTDQILWIGQGLNVQASYLTPQNWSPIIRWSQLQPHSFIADQKAKQSIVTLGLTKYLKKHSVKAMGDLSFEAQQTTMRFQLEFGI